MRRGGLGLQPGNDLRSGELGAFSAPHPVGVYPVPVLLRKRLCLGGLEGAALPAVTERKTEQHPSHREVAFLLRLDEKPAIRSGWTRNGQAAREAGRPWSGTASRI